jgi:hypothetical protein
MARLSNQQQNAFATSLAREIVKRAKGTDDSALRLCGVRPADHILTGFLTPADNAENGLEETEVLYKELPKDDALQQTAIGIEWLCPTAALNSASISITAGWQIYVRRLPTLAEQRSVTFRKPTNSDLGKLRDVPQETTRVAELLPVWSQEMVNEFSTSLPLSSVIAEPDWRRTIVLDEHCLEAWSAIDKTNLFVGKRPVLIEESSLADNQIFGSVLAAIEGEVQESIWTAAIDVRVTAVPTIPTMSRVALRLLNYSDALRSQQLDFRDPNLYAAALKVELPKEAHAPTIFRELPASYRYDRQMAGLGINAQVVYDALDSNRIRLKAETAPLTVTPRLEARELPNVNPTFEALAVDPFPILNSIRNAMQQYEETEWAAKVATLSGIEKQEAEESIHQFQEERLRFTSGIELLGNSNYSHVKQAFSLMNLAMQRSSTKYNRWHLFQLVFIVSQLPGLASREYNDLQSNDNDVVDILWFAAGGGKTEAFIGVILWQAFFDRLRGKTFGVSSYVRFPLRLLTFQQLQRLAKALGQAELLRNDRKLGGARFSIGYLVGSGVTPNKISPDLHQRFVRHGVEPRLKRIFKCPFCSAEVDLSYDQDNKVVEHRCLSANCPGGKQRLPIYVVDSDVYRFLPTVIISTVDKLALLGQQQRFSNLFGRVEALCPHHGATFRDSNADFCEAAKSAKKGELPDKCSDAKMQKGPFHDLAPSLLVQDELHLLSEELGTFDSHYETAAMELAKACGCRPWKIIAATATISEYRQHSYQLYLRDARQFPGPGPTAWESFYYVQHPSSIGRIFVGMLGVGRKHTPAVSRLLTLIYLELERFRDLAARDVARASSIIGCDVTAEELQTLTFLYELPLTYVLTRKGSDQVAEAIESRVKKEIIESAPNHGELIVDTFNGGVDIAEMIQVMERIQSATPAPNPEERIRGLVTTNIIGHGVDVDRFNLIVFAGATRLVAEYIQASARVGRTFPGISFFVPTPQSERDRSIFNSFTKYHEYLDRLVDPSAVNRWPEPAMMRTVPGILCCYLFGVASIRAGRVFATVEAVQQFVGSAGAPALNSDEVVSWIQGAYGTVNAPSPTRYRDKLDSRVRNVFSTIINTQLRSGGMHRALNIYLGSMQSLRDVDDPGFISVNNPADKAMLRRMSRD